jgi:hypothetical protein
MKDNLNALASLLDEPGIANVSQLHVQLITNLRGHSFQPAQAALRIVEAKNSNASAF